MTTVETRTERETPLRAARELLGDRYDVRRVLGTSRAYLGFETEQEGRRGTLIVLPIDCEGDDDKGQEVVRRLRELRTFEHPWVASVRDAGVRHGVPHVEVAPHDGCTLREEILRGPVRRERALGIALDLLEALSAAHARGITHGELGPDDVGLVRDAHGQDRVRITGIGLASIVSEHEPLPLRTGKADERDRYVAPEVLAGAFSDGRADVYSVGAILYRMITDEVPPPPPAVAAFSGNPLLPPDLEPLFMRALAPEPFDRYASVEEMSEEIRHALGAHRAAPSRPIRVHAPKARERRSVAPAIAGAIAVGVGAAIAIAAVVLRSDESTADARSPEIRALASNAEPTNGPTTPDSDESDKAPAASASADVTAPPSAVEPRARDRAPLPPVLAEAQARIDRGERLTRGDVAPLYAYAHEHPDDARPQVLLGHAFVDLGWHTDAITRYRAAHRILGEAPADPLVLENLVMLTFVEGVADDAASTIADVYGAAARPAVEAAIAAEPDGRTLARLQTLAARLSAR